MLPHGAQANRSEQRGRLMWEPILLPQHPHEALFLEVIQVSFGSQSQVKMPLLSTVPEKSGATMLTNNCEDADLGAVQMEPKPSTTPQPTIIWSGVVTSYICAERLQHGSKLTWDRCSLINMACIARMASASMRCPCTAPHKNPSASLSQSSSSSRMSPSRGRPLCVAESVSRCWIYLSHRSSYYSVIRDFSTQSCVLLHSNWNHA